MAERDSDRVTKTVKGVSRKAWERAVEAADANDESFGAWLTDVLEERLARRANDAVMPPDRLPTRLPEEMPPARPRPQDALVAIATALGAVAGTKGNGGFARQLREVGRQHLEALALAPLPARKPPRRIGQTKTEIGQTSADGKA